MGEREDVWAEQKKEDMNNCPGLSEKLENVSFWDNA